MAPQITDIKELQFNTRLAKAGLRVTQFTCQTSSDFIATQGSSKRDVAFFSEGTGGGIAINPFYTASETLPGFQLGDNLHVLNAKDQNVTIVHLN